MKYVLATTEKIIRWYAFNPGDMSGYEIIDQLDTSCVPATTNKENAKQWAQSLGLKSWRYVRF